MRRVVEFDIREIMPEREAVLRFQGIGETAEVPQKIQDLLTEAFENFLSTCEPSGVVADISLEKFSGIFPGEGLNAPDAPLARIYPQADRLALFALTMGRALGERIHDLFGAKDYALGSLLDAVASMAAGGSGEIFERYFEAQRTPLSGAREYCVMSYSPGYCGWHISGQKKLFRYLGPEEIGISLNPSYLMMPLKSVTGLLLDGEREMQQFEPTFSFCTDCKTYACRRRMQKLSSL
jgi:hypothetical protein